MSEVTVVGLGNMGSALARVLVEHGFSVTVWNRSPAKAAPLVEKGAAQVLDISEAVDASPVVLMCVTNQPAAEQILSECPVSLAGKLLVQLSTGTPEEARAREAWAHLHQMKYLEAKITGGPGSIGKPEGHVLVSGAETAFHKAEPFLRVLFHKLDYKGAEIGLAAAWDLIMIMPYYGMFLSLLHSIQICQAEGIALEQLSSLLGEQGKGYEQWLCDNIRTGNYAVTSSPLELWANGIQLIARHAHDSQIDARFPLLTLALFQKAMGAGYGREEVSALYKVLE